MEIPKMCLNFMEYNQQMMRMGLEMYNQYIQACSDYWSSLFKLYKKT